MVPVDAGLTGQYLYRGKRFQRGVCHDYTPSISGGGGNITWPWPWLKLFSLACGWYAGEFPARMDFSFNQMLSFFCCQICLQWLFNKVNISMRWLFNSLAGFSHHSSPILGNTPPWYRNNHLKVYLSYLYLLAIHQHKETL